MNAHTTPSTGSTQFCWICGRPVDLKTAQTDKHGNAVHEDCYVSQIRVATQPLRLKPQRPFDYET
jgi:hypothetical protein